MSVRTQTKLIEKALDKRSMVRSAPVDQVILRIGPLRLSSLGLNAWYSNLLPMLKYIGLAVLMAVMMYAGYTQQVQPPADGKWGDVYRYQCFAVAFWQGSNAMNALRPTQCDDIRDTLISDQASVRDSHVLPIWIRQRMLHHGSTGEPFHTLPIEYPIVALVPMSLPLLAGPDNYGLAFASEMILLALALYGLLGRVAGWNAAAFFALCMALGTYSTGASRFDLVPAGLTLVALLFAERRQWTAAYVVLALATFAKFYPVLLVLPLVVLQLRQLGCRLRWPDTFRWSKLRDLYLSLGAFVATCVLLFTLTVIINPVGAYRQVAKLSHRPLEVESLPATIAWFGSHAGFPMQPLNQFGSDNIVSPLSPALSLVATFSLVAGVLFICWAVWNERSGLGSAWLGVLLLILATGKIFSAQYLIWVLPLAAYLSTFGMVGQWLWLVACALTTFSFPFLWRSSIGGWHAVIALRNAIVLVLTAVVVFPQPNTAISSSSVGSRVEEPDPLPWQAPADVELASSALHMSPVSTDRGAGLPHSGGER
jgi:hypothetical protein